MEAEKTNEQYICPETGVDLTTDPGPLAVQTLPDGTPRCVYFAPVAGRPDDEGLRQCILARTHEGDCQPPEEGATVDGATR